VAGERVELTYVDLELQRGLSSASRTTAGHSAGVGQTIGSQEGLFAAVQELDGRTLFALGHAIPTSGAGLRTPARNGSRSPLPRFCLLLKRFVMVFTLSEPQPLGEPVLTLACECDRTSQSRAQCLLRAWQNWISHNAYPLCRHSTISSLS
jgi:hypothetical protein